MMDVILGRGAVSFFDMEVQAFRIAVDATSGIMTRLIQQADEELFRQRDRSSMRSSRNVLVKSIRCSGHTVQAPILSGSCHRGSGVLAG